MGARGAGTDSDGSVNHQGRAPCDYLFVLRARSLLRASGVGSAGSNGEHIQGEITVYQRGKEDDRKSRRA